MMLGQSLDKQQQTKQTNNEHEATLLRIHFCGRQQVKPMPFQNAPVSTLNLRQSAPLGKIGESSALQTHMDQGRTNKWKIDLQ